MARAAQPRRTAFSSCMHDAEPPEPWEYACKMMADDEEADPADPTVLEYVELEKQDGISLTTVKEARANTGAQREQWLAQGIWGNLYRGPPAIQGDLRWGGRPPDATTGRGRPPWGL